MTYGVDALPLIREQVENCSATLAKLLLTDDFCELKSKKPHYLCVSYMNWQPRSWLWHERKLLRAFHWLLFFFVFTNSRISLCTIPSWLWQTTRDICTKFTLTATKREIRSALGYKGISSCKTTPLSLYHKQYWWCWWPFPCWDGVSRSYKAIEEETSSDGP